MRWTGVASGIVEERRRTLLIATAGWTLTAVCMVTLLITADRNAIRILAAIVSVLALITAGVGFVMWRRER